MTVRCDYSDMSMSPDSTAETLISINPADLETVGEVRIASSSDVTDSVARARSAQGDWARRSVIERAQILVRAAEIMAGYQEKLTELVIAEEGKVHAEAWGEVFDSAHRIRYFAQNGPEVLAAEEIQCKGFRAVVEKAPMGVVAAVMPWNFPVSIPLWTIAPALLAGNAVVFKPSEHTPILGNSIHEIFMEAGISEDVFIILHGADEVGRSLVAANVDMIGFVGSRTVGCSIMTEAAKGMKRLALELGGKDPMLVLEDADVDEAAQGAVSGAFKNCGQVCCSVERIYVASEIYDEFVDNVVSRVEDLKIGPGSDESSQVGPIISESDRRRVRELIEETESAGGVLTTGGEALEGKGFFMQPAVMTSVPLDSRMAQKENFGPVVQIAKVKDDEEAVELANSLPFGLTASVWTGDLERGERIARQLDAGTRAINQTIGSIVEMSWGGRKTSGIGRMLSREGIEEFTESVTLRLPQNL